MIPDPAAVPQEGRDYQRFSHEAMATTFEVLVSAQDPTYAAQAATACFAQLDDLERQLSRYLPHSDISQLNRAAVGESVVLGIEALACLQQAEKLYDLTAGALDVTIGTWTRGEVDLRRNTEEGGRSFGLEINTETMTATRLREDVSVDLGAVGKGFALDHLKGVLAEWKIERVLLHGGSSTVLALDAPAGYAGWPVTISHPMLPQQVIQSLALVHRAVSGSAQQSRAHILNPQTVTPVADVSATWSYCTHGAYADGLSTAFMVLSSQEIQALAATRPDVGCVRIMTSGEVERMGLL